MNKFNSIISVEIPEAVHIKAPSDHPYCCLPEPDNFKEYTQHDISYVYQENKELEV